MYLKLDWNLPGVMSQPEPVLAYFEPVLFIFCSMYIHLWLMM